MYKALTLWLTYTQRVFDLLLHWLDNGNGSAHEKRIADFFF